MTQEEFKHLGDCKRELEAFLEDVNDESFDAIGTRKIILAYEIHHYITDKDIIKEIIDLVKSKLADINKKIEEL